MTDSEQQAAQAPEQDKSTERPPQSLNAQTHGGYTFLRTGRLPSDMQDFDKEKAQEFLALAGGEPRFKYAAELCGTAYTVVRLIVRYMEKTHDPNGDTLPGGLKVLGSYMEILRRNLEAMGLTPASAGKIKLDDDPLSAAKVLSDLKGKDDQK